MEKTFLNLYEDHQEMEREIRSIVGKFAIKYGLRVYTKGEYCAGKMDSLEVSYHIEYPPK